MKSAFRRCVLVAACAAMVLVRSEATVTFQLREGGSLATSASLPPGGLLTLDVVAVSIAAEPGVQDNLDSFTYRIVFPNPQFTLQNNVFSAPFDNAQVPGGFNGSIPWSPLPVAILPPSDAGSPGNTPAVSDLYRTTATTAGVPVTGADVVVETLDVDVPIAPGVYLITLNILEAADALGALHGTENGIAFTLTVGVDPCDPDETDPIVTLNGADPLTVECHTAFVDPGATATDACDGALPVTSSGVVDPDTPGSYVVTYTATDAAGNSGSVTRTVNVVDTTDPVVTIIGDDPLIIPCHSPFIDPGANFADTCDPTLNVSVAGTVDVDVAGDYLLTYSATDSSGNTGTATRTVRVTACPEFTLICPPDITVPNDDGECDAVVTYPDPVASGGVGAVVIVCNPPSGSVFPVGTTIVNCTATDADGQTATCSFAVTVEDEEAPVITCPPDVTVACLADVPDPDFAGGGVDDNCDPAPVVTHIGDVSAGSNPVIITRTYEAEDEAGNVSTCEQTITVTGLVGDLDGDCCVDRDDLTLIQAQIRARSNDLTYDLNGDGAVNIADARTLVLLFTNPGGAPCP